MSAGRFSRLKYETDGGAVHPIRVQPETEAADLNGTQNIEPAGAITDNTFIKVNKGTREYGIGSRLLFGEWTGTPPTGYDDRGVVRIPVLVKATYDAINLLDTVTYLGASVTVTRKKPESVR